MTVGTFVPDHVQRMASTARAARSMIFALPPLAGVAALMASEPARRRRISRCTPPCSSRASSRTRPRTPSDPSPRSARRAWDPRARRSRSRSSSRRRRTRCPRGDGGRVRVVGGGRRILASSRRRRASSSPTTGSAAIVSSTAKRRGRHPRRCLRVRRGCQRARARRALRGAVPGSGRSPRTSPRISPPRAEQSVIASARCRGVRAQLGVLVPRLHRRRVRGVPLAHARVRARVAQGGRARRRRR